MIYVHCYFDESLPGSNADSKVVPEFVVVAGFADLTDNWLPFAIKWGKILAEPRSIEYFHSVEANGRRGEFEGFSRRERDNKVISLIDVIKEHRPQPLISSLYPGDYAKLLNEFPGVMPKDPYIFCLYHLMIEAYELNKRRKTAEPFRISLIFENNVAMEKKARRSFELVSRENPAYAEVFERITFGDKKALKPLQAADALAYDLNKDFTSRLRTPTAKTRKSLEAILERVPRRGVYWPWDYDNLRKIFETRYNRVKGNNDEDIAGV